VIECFKATKHNVPITLENTTEIKTGVVWGYKIVEGGDGFEDGDIVVEVKCDGVCGDKIGKLEAKEFKVGITCLKVGNLKLDVYCKVEGMVENDGECRASLSVECLGLSVAIEILNDEKDESTICEISSKESGDHNLRMDFGSLSLFEIKKRSLTIRNTSGVTSNFKIGPSEYTTTSDGETGLERVHAHASGIFSHRAMEKMSSLPMVRIFHLS
jgi:hypothetical protein